MKQLALAIVGKQSSFLGYPLHVNHGRVCYLSTEDEQIATWRVLEKQIIGSGIIPANDSLVFVFDLAGLQAYLREKGDTLDLIIVDTFADIFQGNPNNLVDVRSNLSRISDLVRGHNVCMVFVHHNVKYSDRADPDKNKMNGSQALEAKLRSLRDLRLGRSGHNNERIMTVIKGNHLPQDQKCIPHTLELNPEHLLFTHQGLSGLSVTIRTNGRYDKDLWLARMARRRDLGESFRTAVAYFREEMPGEDIPSETWFKENFRDIGGQSNPNEEERPTGPALVIEGVQRLSSH